MKLEELTPEKKNELASAIRRQIESVNGHDYWLGEAEEGGRPHLQFQTGVASVTVGLSVRRVRYEILHGPLASDVKVYRTCPAPRCVNPRHATTDRGKKNRVGGFC